MLGKNLLLLRKAFSTSGVRFRHQGGIPGASLPFYGLMKNRFKMTAAYIIYFGVGSTAPFLVLRLQYYKKSN